MRQGAGSHLTSWCGVWGPSRPSRNEGRLGRRCGAGHRGGEGARAGGGRSVSSSRGIATNGPHHLCVRDRGDGQTHLPRKGLISRPVMIDTQCGDQGSRPHASGDRGPMNEPRGESVGDGPRHGARSVRCEPWRTLQEISFYSRSVLPVTIPKAGDQLCLSMKRRVTHHESHTLRRELHIRAGSCEPNGDR